MKRLIIALALFQSFCCFAQDDSIPTHGTIRVAKHRDSTYIKAYVKFYVYANNPAGNFTYKDYVMQMYEQRYVPAAKSERIKFEPAKPVWDGTEAFDYTMYFQKNSYTKNIKLRAYESDTVRLLINVSNTGEVKFTDLVSIEKYAGVPYVMRNEPRMEFKKDNCHNETQNAFKELTSEKWAPAVISVLKTHPSKRKKPYKTTKAYTQGILTIVYSGEPMEE